MKRNFLHAIIVLLCLITSGAYATEASSAKVISHKEWVTGNIKLKYTLSNPKQDIIDSLVNKFRPSKRDDDFKEFVNFDAAINYAETEYNDSGNKTKIESVFFGVFNEFDYNQVFTINRALCITPFEDESTPSTCIHTEDRIWVDEKLIIDFKSINLDVYNLKSGEKYRVETDISIKKAGETTAYRTGVENLIYIKAG